MKKVKILTITLVVVLITLIAFQGVYVLKQNRMEDKVKKYSYQMDLSGARNIKISVDTSKKEIIKDEQGNEVKDTEELTDEQIAEKGYVKEEVLINNEDKLNKENYEECKKIIEKRLEKLEVNNYEVRLDEETGDMLLKIPEDDKADKVVSNIATAGKFQMIDTNTQEELMNNEDIKLANVMYGSGSNSTSATAQSGTTVYLNIEFNKEGAKKLEDISTKYVKVEEENSDENEEETQSEDTADENKIAMKIDEQEIINTSFEEPIKTGKLQLSIGKSTTEQSTLKDYVDQASTMATILDVENMPVSYKVEKNEYIQSEITDNELNMFGYVIAGVVVFALIVLVVRYKVMGVLGAVSYIGLTSIFLLIIRYANVKLSIQGLIGIIITLVLNYVFVNKLLNKSKKENVKTVIKEVYKEIFVKILPICIASITFAFAKWAPISGFGMVMFWGIVLIAIYNIIITNILLRINANK